MESEPIRLILLPGVYGTGLMFTPLVNALPDEYDCRVISYPVDQVLSYTELVRYVAAKIPQDKPFIILAESFSGPIALMLSEVLGDNLKALMLVCTYVTNPHPWLAKLSRFVLKDRIVARQPSRFMTRFMIAGFAMEDDLLDLAFSIQRKVSPRVFRYRLYEGMAVDVSAVLKKSSLPILHMYARHDRIIPRSAQRKIKKIRPDLKSIAIPGPHYLLQSKPDICVAYIKTFIESI